MNIVLPAYACLALVAAPSADCMRIDERVLDAISADSLRGHLSFIASDLLEGRDTPSPGLEIASEYIAAQFRRAGLEPIGDDGYFQTTTMQTDDPHPGDFACAISAGGNTVGIDAGRMSLFAASSAVDLKRARVVTVDFPLSDQDVDVTGPFVLATRLPDFQSLPREEMRDAFRQFNDFTTRAADLGAAAIINVDVSSEEGTGLGRRSRMRGRGGVPVFTLHGRDIAALIMSEDGCTIDLEYSLPAQREETVRNVVGLVRGSDPELTDTYILVTAHYDHVGRGTPVNGDDIYNGANDDGSGTVSVIELANAFARFGTAPKRSIIFMCVFGEERGLLGSRHYIDNPIVPLKQTIANINLEHLGRTDDNEGESVARLMPTGYDYSTVVQPFIEAGEETGVDIHHHPRNSASFFARSDNVAFASAGIPAHTFCAAFIFPDYHGAGDHWDRIDYDNLELVNRAIALGLLKLADAETAPSWNADHRATSRYIRAWEELHGSGD